MSWIMGKQSEGNDAVNYKDFSDWLVAAATGSSIDSVALGAAGTGYTVGDILTLTGGTSTIQGQVEVLTITGGGGTGPVGTVRRYNDGIYSVTPGTSATTGGTGSGCTITATIASNGWTASRNSTLGVSSVDSIAAAGTGYSVDDLITLAGGTTTHPAVLRVTSVSVGQVTGVSIEDPGSYTTAPGDPVAQDFVTPSGASGATFNLTFTAAAGTREVVLEGSGGGTDEIFIGWRTFEDTVGDYYNLELHGLTGYGSALPFKDQPGISDGFYDTDGGEAKAGAYLISYNASHDWFLQVTPYRMVGVTKQTGRYFNFYMGWGNRFATAGEYPYPMVISGNTALYDDTYSQTKQSSGLTDPWRSTDGDGNDRGPMLVYMPDGTWYGVANASVSTSSRNQLLDRVVLPCGDSYGPTQAPQEDRFFFTSNDFGTLIPQSGLSATPGANLWPTEPGDERVLFPTMVLFWLPSPQVVCELDNVFWCHAFGGVAAEDRIIVGGEVYRVFQNCNRTDLYAYFAIKEV